MKYLKVSATTSVQKEFSLFTNSLDWFLPEKKLIAQIFSSIEIPVFEKLRIWSNFVFCAVIITLFCFFFPRTNFIFFILFVLSFFIYFIFSTRFLHFRKTFGHFYVKGLWNVIKINILHRYLQLSLTVNSIKHIH